MKRLSSPLASSAFLTNCRSCSASPRAPVNCSISGGNRCVAPSEDRRPRGGRASASERSAPEVEQRSPGPMRSASSPSAPEVDQRSLGPRRSARMASSRAAPESEQRPLGPRRSASMASSRAAPESEQRPLGPRRSASMATMVDGRVGECSNKGSVQDQGTGASPESSSNLSGISSKNKNSKGPASGRTGKWLMASPPWPVFFFLLGEGEHFVGEFSAMGSVTLHGNEAPDVTWSGPSSTGDVDLFTPPSL
mmetsp:Transcript_17582/g.56973  ORF Transcript_17582/g.56973 Transcript_17582/m.56973 type:complete len:251 (-) Transcript_17582:61-813(-)